MNLSEYIEAPFTEQACFDLPSFKKGVAIAVRGLDSIIDENLNNHALPEQRDMAFRYRNIGLGYMGLADALIKLGIKYGSQESINFVEFINKIMLSSAITASSELAKEKGSFPMYRPEVFDATILSGVFNQNELDELKNRGLRNCSLISIAPTGSLGTMLNVSTGIEPNFAFEFVRKTESLEGNVSTYHKVYAGIAAEFNSLFSGVELPEHFVTAHNIDWRDRIALQAAAQKYVDTAISATINLPKDITIDEVEELYLEAWRQGLKGVTIYRDGCRDGILTTETPKESAESFFERPQVLEAKVVHFLNETTPWIAFVGMKSGQPFEIFSGPADLEMFPIPKSIKTGQIIKVKDGETRYDFRYIDAYGYQNTLGGLSRIFNKEYWNYARLISGLLRNQVKLTSIVEIIENMHSDSTSLHSWKNGVIRALKTFIEDGATSTDKCPECGQPMVYTGGCKQCSACGWSKC